MASVREPCEGSRYFIENGCTKLELMLTLNKLPSEISNFWINDKGLIGGKNGIYNVERYLPSISGTFLVIISAKYSVTENMPNYQVFTGTVVQNLPNILTC